MFRRCRVAVAVWVMMVALVLAVGLGGCGDRSATMERPAVEGGLIQGVKTDGVWSFLGIPYAAPPVGELRWKPPQPVEPWKDVRSCKDYAPSCPQLVGMTAVGPLSVGDMSEDCLYLNIWSPAERPSDALPVMVWLHGGSFVSGSGSLPLYSGNQLARKGAVVVTVNYRLGPLGFLAHPGLSEESAEGVSGNYGLLDQIAALEWVQRNIAFLGGDPHRVTVFGESAGAMSILHLMVSPRAEGLFQRAIAQSAVLLEEGFNHMTGRGLEAAEQIGLEIAAELGAVGHEAVNVLRAKTPEQLLAARPAGDDFLNDGLTYAPVVDGSLLPESPSAAFAAGRQHDIPLLLGSNADEGNLFLSMMDIGDAGDYAGWLGALFGPLAPDVLALYPAATESEVSAACSRILTELGFAATARFVAESMSAHKQSPVYLYEFTRVPLTIPIPSAPQGAFHGIELPYVFGQAAVLGVADPVDVQLSERIMDYWVAFAATGSPEVAGGVTWPAYEVAEGRYLELGDAISVKSGLYDDACGLAHRIREAGLP